MRSPKHMKIIQIDITNACIFSCSNCTRMCGHHEKTFMMDFETFKRAVDSLEGFPSTVGIIGGEPTLHPEFERFALYLQSKYPHLYGEDIDTHLLHPLTDYMKSVQDTMLSYMENKKTARGDSEAIPTPGLFSAVGSTYLKHFEVIHDTFKRISLNDHSNEMYHQPALVSRKDLGIPDDEWLQMRDDCWLQNNWSATITPKGAFFCEIAGGLDMLFDGPGGWPIEKDWWKREPEEFGDQLKWCEICGFPCKTYTRNANETIDDVSSSLYEKLEKVNSPKVKAGKVNVIEVENGVITEQSKAESFTYENTDLSTGSPYIKFFSEKYSAEKSVLLPQNLIGVFHFHENTNQETIRSSMKFAENVFQKVYVLWENGKVFHECEGICDAVKNIQISSYNLETEAYGHVLNQILRETTIKDYIIASSGTWSVTPEFIDMFKKSTPNPGVLIYIENKTPSKQVDNYITSQADESGFLAVFNPAASSLKKMGFDGRANAKSFQDLVKLWQSSKIIAFDENLFVGSSKEVIQEGDRCVIFGAGGRAEDVYYLIMQRKGTCVGIVDSNPDKQGRAFEEFMIESPEVLSTRIGEIDRILIGAAIYFEEIKEKLLEFGFNEDIINQI